MRKTTLSFVLSVLSLFAISVNAAGQKGGGCLAANSVGGSGATYYCDHIGQVTLKQIYEKGFRVVAYDHDPRNDGRAALIIEEQTKNDQPQS